MYKLNKTLKSYYNLTHDIKKVLSGKQVLGKKNIILDFYYTKSYLKEVLNEFSTCGQYGLRILYHLTCSQTT